MSVAHLTAISRKTISQPMQKLASKLIGRTLDYGCGRGYDATQLGLEQFDPYYQPNMPSGQFQTIVCNYVLNVIESLDEKRQVLADIQSRLSADGIAYISVRNDRKALRGQTSKGTWQDETVLDLPIVCKNSNHVTYALSKNSVFNVSAIVH